MRAGLLLLLFFHLTNFVFTQEISVIDNKGNILLRKEQCPTCASRGKDTSKDNLAVYSDGQTHCFSCGTHKGGGGKEGR